VNKTVAASLKLIMVMNRLTRPSFGLLAKYVCQLYISMVLPKMEYALPVWYTPIREGKKQKAGSIGHTKQLETIQRLAYKLITGAFHSTATDILEAHAFIPPLRIRLEDTCH
jgi:hypothetical protein